MVKVYVVTESSGGYDSTDTRVVKVCAERERADDFVRMEREKHEAHAEVERFDRELRARGTPPTTPFNFIEPGAFAGEFEIVEMEIE